MRVAQDRDDDDARLLRRFAAGDAAALDALVERHGRTVYAFVWRVLDRTAAADDVYQEAWLRVIRGAKQFEGRSRFTTWLFQLTRNCCIDHLRDVRRRRGRATPEAVGEDIGALADGLPDPAPGAPVVAERAELRRAIEAAVASLPAEQREVFLLRETTDMTFTEIARATSASPNTAKSRMRYALEHVRRCLGPLAPGSAAGSRGEAAPPAFPPAGSRAVAKGG